MCGRAYQTYTDEELELRYLNRKAPSLKGYHANYNMAPSQLSPVVRMEDGQRQLSLLKWGLVPSWSKDEKIGYKMINARSETVFEKPSFRVAIKQRRCIVPLSGFIEWKQGKAGKIPYAISLVSDEIMSVAGIWEIWKKPEGSALESFTILTTQANDFMKNIHDRMPVLLDLKSESDWLDSTISNQEAINPLLKPCPNKWLKSHPISTRINNPRNNSLDLIQPHQELLSEDS